MMKKISILIPIYNRLEITKKGLASIFNSIEYYLKNDSFNFHFDLVVIDDGSTDGSSDYIVHNYPSVYIVKGDGNLWWAGAINVGIDFAIDKLGSNYVLLWNDDCIIQEDYFLNVVKLLDNENSQVTIFSSMVYHLSNPKKVFYAGGTFDFQKALKKTIGSNELDEGQFKNKVKSQWSGGMGVLIPSAIIKSIGKIDNETFPQYYGDADFGLRASKAGYQMYCVPTLKVWNDRSSTGLVHSGSFKKYWKSLSSIQSPYNIQKDYLFYRRYANVFLTFIRVFRKQRIYFLQLIKRNMEKMNLIPIKSN